ncbi:hypothetical protein LJK88_26250 [Paenibacillus sp. P26]|nr:hypothetical protein LJK88_26250 [Paenibacillus sp. P26]
MKMKVLDYVERIEHIEVELTKLNAARSLTERERRLEVTVSGSCTLLRDLNDPASMYYNRIKGFGPADAAHVDRLLTHYDENNAPVVDMTPDRLTAETASALIERGYQPVQQLAFMRAAPWIGEADRETSLRIEQVGERNAEEFIRWIGLSKGGTEFSPHVVKRVEKYFYRPDFRNYMLTIGESPLRWDLYSCMGQKPTWRTIIRSKLSGDGDVRRHCCVIDWPPPPSLGRRTYIPMWSLGR